MTLDEIKAKLPQITGNRLALAEKAIAAGIAIVTDKATGKRCAIVGSKSGAGCYVVKGTGCTCKGYANRSRCAHFDAVALLITARAEQKEAAAAADLCGQAAAACLGCGATIIAPETLCDPCNEAALAADREAAEAAPLCTECGAPALAGFPLCLGCRVAIDLAELMGDGAPAKAAA